MEPCMCLKEVEKEILRLKSGADMRPPPRTLEDLLKETAAMTFPVLIVFYPPVQLGIVLFMGQSDNQGRLGTRWPGNFSGLDAFGKIP